MSEYSGTWDNGYDIWMSCFGGTGGGIVTQGTIDSAVPGGINLTVEEGFNGQPFSMKVEVVDDTIRSDAFGTYRIRLECARLYDKACALDWRDTYSDVYYGSLLFIPDSYQITTGPYSDGLEKTQKLCQIHEGPGSWWAGGLQVDNYNPGSYPQGRLRWRLHKSKPSTSDDYLWTGDIADYTGRWIKYMVHMDQQQNGALEVWLDGVKLIDEDPFDMRMSDEAIVNGRASRYPEWGIYGGMGTGNNSFYFTRCIIAPSIQAVSQFISEPYKQSQTVSKMMSHIMKAR